MKRTKPPRRAPRRRALAGRHHPAQSPLLPKLTALFTPKPYDEGEAVMDALGGRSACRHGMWPHQHAICPMCATEVALKAFSKLFEDTP